MPNSAAMQPMPANHTRLRSSAQSAMYNAPYSNRLTTNAIAIASIVGCAAGYAGAGEIGPLTENFGHTSLHYGNMITYMRMLGLTPPSS